MAQLWCGWQVVMVGHALHHDLRALKLDFLPVIDTSLVTSYRCGLRTVHCSGMGDTPRIQYGLTLDALTGLQLQHTVQTSTSLTFVMLFLNLMGEFYPFRGLPEATPALTALASAFLNRQLRLDGAIHDVADDARAALDVALYEIQKGPSPELEPPLIKVRQSPTAGVCSRQ